jgi:integrase
MKQRFRMFRRGNYFWSHDGQTGKQESLRTKDKATGRRLLHAKNEAHQQPAFNLQIARAYLAASDPEIVKRTWQTAMNEIVRTKRDATRIRWERAIKDRAFDLIRGMSILETRSEHFLQVLHEGTVSTNAFLRKIHNFAVDMNWLPATVIPRRQWPAIHYKEKRAITIEEHQKILAAETNAERRAFYEICWHLGAAQSDVANLSAEDVDWSDRVVSFFRKKTKTVSLVRFDNQLAEILNTLPLSGRLFPKFGLIREAHRATEFKRCCRRAGIEGVTLHSYRYGFAQRALQCGYPERFAQEALGHNSKAVHRSYARKAKVTLPSLNEWAAQLSPNVVPFDAHKSAALRPTVAIS